LPGVSRITDVLGALGLEQLKLPKEHYMNVMGLVTELVAGGVGGNIAGALLKKFDLGPIGNTVAGLIGGVGGGQLLNMLTAGSAAATAASTGGTDLTSILSNAGGAGVGGAVVVAIIGLIKTQMAKST
jgi:uncharacterized membrane protein YeaQ/YmgE (transglycosylase-associated protein family)